MRAAILALAVALVLVACRNDSGDEPLTYEFEFSRNDAGFTPGFAGLPADADPATYALLGLIQPLPNDMSSRGYFLKGSNESGELFLFLKRQIAGLEPNTEYQATFEVDLLTAIPEGISSPLGSPGEDVFVKTGATTAEPVEVTDERGWSRLSIDIGDPGEGGADTVNLGNIAYQPTDPEDDGSWQTKTLSSAGQRFMVSSDAEGNLWLLVGVHSDFEGLSALYLQSVAVSLAQ